MRNGTWPVAACALLALQFLVGPVSAQAPGPEEISPFLSPTEIETQFKKLSAQGWQKGDMRAALAITRGDRVLFDIYVKLLDDGIPPGMIESSFAASRGEPAAVNEYWKWIRTHKFSASEVHQVFARFPDVQMTRYYYFSYRAGGPEGLADRENTDSRAVAQKVARYSREECMAIFRGAKYQMDYVKLYLDLREGEEKKLPREAWAVVKEKMLADAAKKKEEERKKREEEMKRRQEERKAAMERAEFLRKAGTGGAAEDEEGDEGGAHMSVDDLDKVLGGDDDEEQDVKGEAGDGEDDETGRDEEEEEPESEDENEGTSEDE